MKLALGLIETRGLVAAIEAADAMAKAANITIVGKEKSTAALITIKIVGEVAAVKSAVDAGAAAAQRIGEVISTHIIPRPAEEISDLINFSDKIIPTQDNKIKRRKRKIRSSENADTLFDQTDKDEESLENSQNDIAVGSSENSDTFENKASALDINEEDFKDEFADVDIDVSSDEDFYSNSENNTAEAVSDATQDVQAESDNSDSDVIHTFKMEELEILNVHQLRRKARNISDFPIKGREISKANRGILLDCFKSLL